METGVRALAVVNVFAFIVLIVVGSINYEVLAIQLTCMFYAVMVFLPGIIAQILMEIYGAMHL